jgi:hypothetical protein
VTRKRVSHLNAAVQHFQLVLDRCPVGCLDRATALTNLAWARLIGYIRDDLHDIDNPTSLFREALALRPQRHPDHLLSLCNLTKALIWYHKEKDSAANIREAAQLYHELLPLCPEGTYLSSIAAGENGVDYVIEECNYLPTDASDEGIHFRRVVLELCVPWDINSFPEPSTGLHEQLKHGLARTAASMILTQAYNSVVKLCFCVPRDMLTAVTT